MSNFIRQKDGFINATEMCKDGGKKFNDWKRLENTKELINKFESECPHITFLDIKKGNSSKFKQGSWIHPYLAVQLAQWISRDFCVKVSKWIEDWKLTSLKNNLEYEKAINNIKADDKNSCIEKEIQLKLHKKLGGEIEVYTEFGYIDLLTDKELIEIKIGNKWKHGVGQLLAYGEYYENHILRLHLFDFKEDIKIMSFCKKYNIKLTYEKFKKGNIFYIISDGDTENLKYKVGIDNVDINVRLQQHRTILPNLKLHYLVYTDSNEMLEDTILNRHKSFRKEFLNHEWLYNLDLSIIKQSCKTYLEFVSADYTVETDIEKYNV